PIDKRTGNYQLNSNTRSFSQKSNFAAGESSPSSNTALIHHSQALLSVDLSHTSVTVLPGANPGPISNLPYVFLFSDTSNARIAFLLLLCTLNVYSTVRAL